MDHTTPESSTCKDCGEQFKQWSKAKQRYGSSFVRCNPCFNTWAASRPSAIARAERYRRRDRVRICETCQTKHERQGRWCSACYEVRRKESKRARERERNANPSEARKAHNSTRRNWTRPCKSCDEIFTDQTARSSCAACWERRPNAPLLGPTLGDLAYLGPVTGPPSPTGHCECGLGLFHTSRKRCPECSRLHNIDRTMSLYNRAVKTLKIKEAMHWRREVIAYLRTRDGDRCALCSGRMKFTGTTGPNGKHEDGATIDHVLPRSLGGSDEWSNLQLACWSCNRAKGNRGGHEQLRLVG